MDVWMKRVFAALYPNGLPDCAQDFIGIAQQYLFHYVRRCPQILEAPEKRRPSGMKSLLSPLALLAALVMTLSGCARTIPPPTSAESASPSAPTVETSDEKPDKLLPTTANPKSTAQLTTEAAASRAVCVTCRFRHCRGCCRSTGALPAEHLLDYLILNTGVYWACDGTLEVSPPFHRLPSSCPGRPSCGQR